MNCTSCNNILEEGSRFCRHCGEKVAIIESSVQKDAEIIFPEPDKSDDAKVSNSCIYCGKTIPGDAIYCRHCGRDLRSVVSENATNLLNLVNVEEKNNTKPSPIISTRYVVAVIVVFLVLVGWGLSFVFKNGAAPVAPVSAAPTVPLQARLPTPETISTLPHPLPVVKNGFLRTVIPELGSIDVPSLMMIQPAGTTQQVTDQVSKAGLSNKDKKTGFVLMQKDSQYYSRILINTYSTEDGARLVEPLAEQSELAELDKVIRTPLEEGIVKMGGKIITWQPTEMAKLNGMNCLKISYRRQAKNDTPVQVYTYHFSNRDRTIGLTMSYRETEATIWQPLFEESLRSFRITDIR